MFKEFWNKGQAKTLGNNIFICYAYACHSHEDLMKQKLIKNNIT